jgi:hypothetical protein
MDAIEISHHLKVSSLEEMNDFSVKLGWDAILYSQLGAGIFDGEYQEGINQSLIVTKESISVPILITGGGVLNKEIFGELPSRTLKKTLNR